MQSTICFFIGMAMMACAIVGYACIRVGAMSEREEMLAEGKREPSAAFGKKIGQKRFRDPAPQTRRFLSGYNYRDCGPFVKSSI